MASLVTQLPDTTNFTEMVSQTVGAVNQARKLVEDIDTAGIAALGSQVASVAVPQAAGWIAPLAGGLEQVASVLPSAGGDVLDNLLQALSQESEQIAGPLAEQLAPLVEGLAPIIAILDRMDVVEGLFTQVLPTITGIKDQIAGVGTDFGVLLGKLLEMMSEIPAVDDILILGEFKKALGQFHALLTQDEAALSAFFAETVNNLASGLGQPFDVSLQEALTRAQDVVSSLQAGNIQSGLGDMESAFGDLQTLDTGSIAGLQEAITGVNQLRTQTDGLATQIQTQVGAARTALVNLDLFNVRMTLEEALFAVAQAVRTGESKGIIGKLLGQLRRYMYHMDLEGITESVLAQLEKARESLKVLDWSPVQQPLKDALETLKGAIDTLEQSIVEVTVKIGAALEQVRQVVNDIDTEAALRAIRQGGQQALQAAQGIIGEVAGMLAQLTTLIDDLTAQVGQVNLTAVKDQLEILLDELTGVLGGAEIEEVLNSLEDAIEQIEKGLKGITFTPVFELVNGEIEEQKEKLAGVDVSSLNPVLLGLLKAAVEVLKQTDFTSTGTQELTEQFAQIMDVPKNAIEPVRQGFRVLSDSVSQFDPVQLAAAPLKPPVEQAKGIIEQASPAVLLFPVEDAFNEVTDQVAKLNVEVLLNPVKDLHGKAMNVVDSLDPSQLTDLLRQGLALVADQLDRLPLKSVSEQLTSLSERVSALVGQLPAGADPAEALNLTLNLKELLDKLDPAVFSTATTQFIDQFTAKLEQVNLDTVRPAFNALADAVSAFQGRFTNSPVTRTLTDLAGQLSQIDPMAALSRAQNAWSQARQAVESIPAPPGGEADKTALLTAMDQAAPMVLLTETVGKLVELSDALNATAEESLDLFQELNFTVEHLWDSLQTWVMPNPDHEALKTLFASTLHNMLVAPLDAMIQDLVQRKAGWEALLEAFEDFMTELRTRLLGFITIPAMLKEMVDTVTGVSDRIRNLDLSAISQGLQGTYGTIHQKVADLNPEVIEAEIQNVVQSLSDSLAALYPRDEVQALDDNFQQHIIGPLTDWDPDRLIGEPLKDAMAEINEALTRLDVEKILDALIKSMARLEEELKTGLAGTGRAFNGLLAAAPV